MTDKVIITHMRPIITEEPIPRVKIPIIDADAVQREQLTTRISLRRLK